MKLALGTVQFGLPYGITNSTGQVAQDEVIRILQRARGLGVDVLDTAAGLSPKPCQRAGRWRMPTGCSK